jgi:hypothetical protein
MGMPPHTSADALGTLDLAIAGGVARKRAETPQAGVANWSGAPTPSPSTSRHCLLGLDAQVTNAIGRTGPIRRSMMLPDAER